jgi:hypothetical protein
MSPSDSVNSDGSRPTGDESAGRAGWPLAPVRQPVRWYPTPSRLINRIRGEHESFILPPAMTRKPPWRE